MMNINAVTQMTAVLLHHNIKRFLIFFFVFNNLELQFKTGNLALLR